MVNFIKGKSLLCSAEETRETVEDFFEYFQQAIQQCSSFFKPFILTFERLGQTVHRLLEERGLHNLLKSSKKSLAEPNKEMASKYGSNFLVKYNMEKELRKNRVKTLNEEKINEFIETEFKMQGDPNLYRLIKPDKNPECLGCMQLVEETFSIQFDPVPHFIL